MRLLPNASGWGGREGWRGGFPSHLDKGVGGGGAPFKNPLHLQWLKAPKNHNTYDVMASLRHHGILHSLYHSEKLISSSK